jgi:protein PhnA
MTTLPPCPKCQCEYTYVDNAIFICPECAHEWSGATEEDNPDADRIIKDSSGNILKDGDTVTVIKDLKVKGSS